MQLISKHFSFKQPRGNRLAPLNTLRLPAIFTLAVLLSACEGPIGFFSGGALTGTEVETPVPWQFEEDYGFAVLETRPEDPYSVNLAYVQMNGNLYVYAGDTRTTWVQHMDENPLVRLQVEELIYPASAVRVDNDDELNEFAAIWTSRSSFQRDPLQFEEVWLYRLEAR